MDAKFADIKAREEKLLCRTYGRYPIAISHGEGSRLYDFDGKEYIDLLAGIAVTALGHSNEEIARVLETQSRKLVHVSNLFYQEEQLGLAERLLGTGHFNRAFFCNSGAEANEAAIKLARRYQQRVKNRQAHEVITFQGCFHGRTLATVAATGQAKFQDGFSPMPKGFSQVEWGRLDLMEAAINANTAAILVEIVQGEGGIRPMTPEYVQGVARICREKGLLFVADEVQAGMGRSGKWWAFQHFGVEPDIMTTAKALANGLPMGAMLGTRDVSRGFVAGSHATTFGAGALVSTAAAKVIEIMRREDLPRRAGELGAWSMERFRAIGRACPGTIHEVRGMGLMIGIELAFPGMEIWERLMERGFIVNLTQERVLRLLPALNVPQEDMEAFAVTLEDLLKKR